MPNLSDEHLIAEYLRGDEPRSGEAQNAFKKDENLQLLRGQDSNLQASCLTGKRSTIELPRNVF